MVSLLKRGKDWDLSDWPRSWFIIHDYEDRQWLIFRDPHTPLQIRETELS